MYSIGEYVRYSGSGICKINDITERDFSGNMKKYYVLAPIRKKYSAVFVPVDNESLVSKIVAPLTESEIKSVILEGLEKNAAWIKDFRKRVEASKIILNSNNRLDILLLIKGIYARKRELSTEGKYMHSSDDYILNDAEELLYGEIAFVEGRDFIEVQNEMRIKFGA